VYATDVVTTSGDLKTYMIKNLSHGAHTLEVYFTAIINGITVPSNRIYHELIVQHPENTTPIITTSFNTKEQEQYISFNIPYYVYTNGLNNSRVQYFVEYQGNRTEIPAFKGGILANRELQNLPYRIDDCYLDETGNEAANLNDYTIIIKSGSVEKHIPITIKKSTINVTPVTTDLILHLDAQGRSNTESLEKRVT
jgi:hypothetical protein